LPSCNLSADEKSNSNNSKTLKTKVIIEETNANPLIKNSWLFGISVITNALTRGKKTTADSPTPFVNISNFPPI
jgi:hypothetical protein